MVIKTNLEQRYATSAVSGENSCCSTRHISYFGTFVILMEPPDAPSQLDFSACTHSAHGQVFSSVHVVPKRTKAHFRFRNMLFLLTVHVVAPSDQSCLQPLELDVWTLGQLSGLCIR